MPQFSGPVLCTITTGSDANGVKSNTNNHNVPDCHMFVIIHM
jgi:hypothetical protein